MAAHVSPAMVRYQAKLARKARIAASRARTTVFIVVNNDTGEVLDGEFSSYGDAARAAADRSHGAYSYLAVSV